MEQMTPKIYPHAPVYLAKRKDGVYEYITEAEKERRDKIKQGMKILLKN